MSSSFSFNEDAFRKIAEEAVTNVAAEQTRDLERLRKQYAGRPVAEIKPALQALFAAYDGSITDPELSDWAQLISDNTRIEMAPAPIDWSR
ncbi:hypothetical protein FVP74_07470 [Microbacterium saccharophilum]|uniref:Uncharacterized protein n=1 Tax=Microbacterium saccharophilum TaxID=1213358 RepID=A0A5C8HXH4_9MICO|nr:hypothetical protein [Microbacterium saccharophilum]TXK11181.1 hypothetical protein FVP74_07470 [Microbacterium saccharophilum]GEP49158.1 hypothetical protein MSA03_26660 [Microbacterium saccharophilum]